MTLVEIRAHAQYVCGLANHFKLISSLLRLHDYPRHPHEHEGQIEHKTDACSSVLVLPHHISANRKSCHIRKIESVTH